jgi:dihydrofolate reductase
MARTVYYCAASLDGYIAESDDSIDWLTGYEGTYDGDNLQAGPLSPGGSYERFYDNVEVLVSGSATYEFILGHVGSGGSWPYGTKPYWVLSSRDLPLPPGDTDVRIVDAQVPELIDDMRAAAGDRDIWIVGGGPVASQFADAGLLDLVDLTVVPVVLGDGKPLFERRLEKPMRLLGTSVYGNGMVGMSYAID